jgi:hypothetical protein
MTAWLMTANKAGCDTDLQVAMHLPAHDGFKLNLPNVPFCVAEGAISRDIHEIRLREVYPWILNGRKMLRLVTGTILSWNI